MNKIQLSRWLAAKKLIEKMLRIAKLSSADIAYEGDIIPIDCIHITDTEIYISDNNMVHTIFDTDPTFDDGLYTRKADFAKWVRASFKIVKYVRY